jgi:hypothetical protein
MKYLMTAFVLLLSPSVFAAPSSLVCHIGTLGEDSFKQISLSKSGVDFQFHETSFTVAAKNLVKSGSTVAIVNKIARGYAEGDALTVKVDSLLIYNAKEKVLFASVVLDGYAQIPGENFDCK